MFCREAARERPLFQRAGAPGQRHVRSTQRANEFKQWGIRKRRLPASHPAFSSNGCDIRFRKTATPRRGQQQLYAILRNLGPKVLAGVAGGEIGGLHIGREARKSDAERDCESCWHEGCHWTTTFAVPPIPMALAAAYDRSMQRPRTKGPRSLMRT